MIRDVADCTIADMQPYIVGEAFTGQYDGARINEQAVELMNRAVSESITASTTLEQCESYKDFYNVEVDFKKLIEPKDRANCFYALKNKRYCLQVPPFCEYMIRRAWDMYKIPNLIPKLLPVQALTTFFKEGYLCGGVTFRDVVCNVVCPEYVPFSESRYKNIVGSYMEIYIEQEDMAAMVPKSIGESLDIDTLKKVRKTDYGLAVNGVLLRTMRGYIGGINSTYDLRALI